MGVCVCVGLLIERERGGREGGREDLEEGE